MKLSNVIHRPNDIETNPSLHEMFELTGKQEQIYFDISQHAWSKKGFLGCMCEDHNPSMMANTVHNIISSVDPKQDISILGIGAGFMNTEITIAIALRLHGFDKDITVIGIDPGLDPSAKHNPSKHGFKEIDATMQQLLDKYNTKIEIQPMLFHEYIIQLQQHETKFQNPVIMTAVDLGGESNVSTVILDLKDLQNSENTIFTKGAEVFFSGTNELRVASSNYGEALINEQQLHLCNAIPAQRLPQAHLFHSRESRINKYLKAITEGRYDLLHHIDLSNQNIDRDQLKPFIYALEQNPQAAVYIHTINLSGNTHLIDLPWSTDQQYHHDPLHLNDDLQLHNLDHLIISGTAITTIEKNKYVPESCQLQGNPEVGMGNTTIGNHFEWVEKMSLSF